MRGRRWTDEDIAMLRRLARTGGSVDDAATALSRTNRSIRMRAGRMRIRLISKRKWTQSEDAILRSVVPRRGIAEALKLLTGRTYSAVRWRAWRLGVRQRHCWTDGDRVLLETVYPASGSPPIVRTLGVSKRSVHREAQRLGVMCDARAS